MIERTWPYGSRKDVRVMRVERSRTQAVAVCVEISNPKEAHILLDGIENIDAETGQTRTIVFTQGGPTGGYWKFEPMKVPGVAGDTSQTQGR